MKRIIHKQIKNEHNKYEHLCHPPFPLLSLENYRSWSWKEVNCKKCLDKQRLNDELKRKTGRIFN